MFGEINITASNILISGAAAGADSEFGKAAAKAKHQIVHWSFKGHTTKLKSNLYALTSEHLTTADPYLIRANKSLIRTFPADDEYSTNLIRRDYYQIKWSQRVYAVSSFTNDASMMRVKGGTAWAVQSYADRFLYDQEPFDQCELYMFDQITSKWYQWNRVWKMIDKPPRPYGVYAGIGSRELADNGKAAIKSLYAKDTKA